MQIRSLLAASALAAATVACGSGSSVNATVSGNLRGQALKPADAISQAVTITTASGPSTVAAIVITNNGGLCQKLTANQEPKNSQYLFFFLGDVNATSGTITAPATTGTFTVYTGAGGATPPPHLALVLYGSTDASCKDADSTSGASGTVTLTGIDNGSYTGSFDVTVQSQDANGNASGGPEHVTGTFGAKSCAGLSTLSTQNRTTTCI